MSNKRVLSFSVCANGDLQINVPKGHRLIVDQSDPTRVRISANPSIWTGVEISRAEAFESAAKIGDVMEDGSIYAGISPSTNQPFFVTASEHMLQLRKAPMKEHIRSGKFHGRDDWQLASVEEYQHLFRHKEWKGIESIVGRPRSYRAINGAGQYETVLAEPNSRHRPMHPNNKIYFVLVRYGQPHI